MAEYRENQSRSSGGDRSSDYASLDLIESIKQLATVGNKGKALLTYDELLFSLRRWWCQHYRRPYKDPLLEVYSFEELLFEYFDIEGPGQDAAAKKEQMIDDDRAWAAEEEAQELAAEEAAMKAAEDAAAAKSDIIKEAKDSDDSTWADKYTTPEPLVNPTPDQADEGGDISTTFGAQ